MCKNKRVEMKKNLSRDLEIEIKSFIDKINE